MTDVAKTVLVHVDKQGYLTVRQARDAVVLFVDERTMRDSVILLPPADQMREIDQIINRRALIGDGTDIAEHTKKSLRALREGLVHVTERT